MCLLTNPSQPTNTRLEAVQASSLFWLNVTDAQSQADSMIFSFPATLKTDYPLFLSSLRPSDWETRVNERACAVGSSIHWRQPWTKQSTPFTSHGEVGGGDWGLALAQAAYHCQCVPWWCQHRISIRRGGREREEEGGGLHHSVMMGGDEQDVHCCQTQLELLTETKRLFLMFDSRKCLYKKKTL